MSVNAYDEAGKFVSQGGNLVTIEQRREVSRSHAVSVEVLGKGMFDSSHAVNVVVDAPSGAERAALQRVYPFCPDAFDGFAISLLGTTVGRNVPNADAVRSDVQGINFEICDNSRDFGNQAALWHSNGLLGEITGTGFLHEFARRYGFLPNAPALNLTGGTGMRVGTSTLLGQFDGGQFLQRQPNGDYLVTSAPDDEPFQARRCSDWELYPMGLLPPQTVAPAQFVTDLSVPLPSHATLHAAKLATVSMDDVIRVYGPRVTAVDASQKRFRYVLFAL